MSFYVEALADFNRTMIPGSSTNDSDNSNQNYLSFDKGDIIVTTSTFENGWWYGYIYNKAKYTEKHQTDKN